MAPEIDAFARNLGRSGFPNCVLAWGGIGARRFFSKFSMLSPGLKTFSVLPLKASESSKNGLVCGTVACEKKVPEREELKKQNNETEIKVDQTHLLNIYCKCVGKLIADW